MKRITWFLPFLLLAGCSLPSISPEQRAYTLVAGVNAVSRDLLADSFLPTIADLAKLQDPAQYPGFWETNFPYANGPYSVTSLVASNPAAVTLILADNQIPPASMNLLLVMGRIGNDWFIQEMQMPPPAVIVQ